MSDLFPVSLDDMIEEARRELDVRKNTYPRWKQGSGAARRNMLDRRYDVMAAIVTHLERERDDKRKMDREPAR